jgi:hypothetical protein
MEAILGIIIAAIDPRNMPIPPNLGIGRLCTLLSSRGLSIMSHLYASFMLSGVVTYATKIPISSTSITLVR